jgi:hypothetical protein
MTELLKKEVKYRWDDKCDEVFHTLRKLLTTAPVLAQPDNAQPFDVYCDASGSLVMHLEHSGTTSKTIQLMILNWQPLFTLLKSGDIILWVLS